MAMGSTADLWHSPGRGPLAPIHGTGAALDVVCGLSLVSGNMPKAHFSDFAWRSGHSCRHSRIHRTRSDARRPDSAADAGRVLCSNRQTADTVGLANFCYLRQLPARARRFLSVPAYAEADQQPEVV